MKTKRIVSILSLMLFCILLLQSCGCGFTFLYNWRPKPWNHPYTANVETGLDSLIDIDGYYLTEDSTKLYSIMFYNNGLCLANNTSTINRSWLHENYTERKFSWYLINSSSWGTYQIDNDTIKAFVIQNLFGCDGTRKNVVSMTYLIQEDKQLKLIFVSNSNKDYGYSKDLNVPACTFYPLKNKLDSNECPYLNKKWFYKSDKK